MLFTILLPGICAYITTLDQRDFIAVGRIMEQQCRPVTYIADKVTTPTIAGHTYAAEISKDNAMLTIDGVMYVIKRKPSV